MTDEEWKQIADGMQQPDAQLHEIQAGGGEQIRRAIAGLIITATVCGALTWAGWVIPQVCRWWTA